MSNCEICGVEEKLVSAIIEGTMMDVCRKCSNFGDVITVEKPIIVDKKPRKIEVEEISDFISNDYSTLIKQGREKRSLKQAELAQKVAEKESVIHKLESGHMKPTIALAVKLEKELNITLVEKYEEPKKKPLDLNDPGLTIGDLIKLKKK